MFEFQKAYWFSLAFALACCAAIFPSTSALACGGSASGFTVGSKNSGSAVTICAQIKTVQPARQAIVKAKPATISKSVIPPKSSSHKNLTEPKPVTTSTAKPQQRVKQEPALFRRPQQQVAVSILKLVVVRSTLVAKPPVKKVIKVVPKPSVKLTSKTEPALTKIAKTPSIQKVLPRKPAAISVVGGEITFSPEPLALNVSPASRVSVGSSVTLSTSARGHSRTGLLLGKATTVEFTPVSTAWQLGDSVISGDSVSYATEEPAQQHFSAKVTYSVRYLVVGSAGWLNAGMVTASASKTVEYVADSDSVSEPVESDSPAKKRALLVGFSCANNPQSFGC